MSRDKDLKPAYVPRLNFGAKLEPKDTVLHGAGQDADGFRDYSAALGKDRLPMIFMTYIGVKLEKGAATEWTEDLKTKMDSQKVKGLIPQIGLNMVYVEDKVANGDYDEWIEEFCLAMKSLSRPVFVRIGYEFDGYWNHYKPEPFKAIYASQRQCENIILMQLRCGARQGPLSREFR